LTAPGGYSVINPLSTLVQSVVASGQSLEEAESSLGSALGIEVGEGGLGTYDPQSDVGENALANRVIATQIATVLAVASSSDVTGEDGDTAETIALQGLTDVITTAGEGEKVNLNSETLTSLLADVVSVEELTTISTAVDAMEVVKESADLEAGIEAIVTAQAIAIDAIAPNAPEPVLVEPPMYDADPIGIVVYDAALNTGLSSTDSLTNLTNPIVRISFDTTTLEGKAAVVGDKLEVFNTGMLAGTYKLTQEDIDKGYIDYSLTNLDDGEKFVSASLSDIAGNTSYLSALKFVVDATPVEITSADTAVVDENSGEGQVVYTATHADENFWKFELSESSDPALSIDKDTGAVTLVNNNEESADFPDFEGQSQYSFTVLAFDVAGNKTEKEITLNVNNLDEQAPTITSSETVAVDENIGLNQIIYTATSDDSADISNGVTYGLGEGSDLVFSINEDTGEVSLADNPDAETQAQ
jgi:hypothetical protein